jgi:4-hydroxy-2-oxoheptanedioate aldolase
VALREDLGNREIIGTFVSISSSTVVEILGQSGFELLCLDSEHAPFGPTEVQELLRAADSVGCQAIVRVPCLGPEVGRALDSGAAGVLVPMVETAAQAEQFVAAVRYPPLGSRGAGPGRATGYGSRFAQYLGSANDEVAAIVQVETREGVDNAKAILAVPGIDMVFVGPGDLAVSLGVSVGADEHLDAIDRVAVAANESGVPFGIFCMTPEDVERWRARGATLFLLAGDLAMLAGAASQLSREARDQRRPRQHDE